MTDESTAAMPPGTTPIVRPEPIIRAYAMAYLRFRRRNPDEMERFLLDFGLVPAAHEGTIRYYRGCGSDPFLVSVEAGDVDAFVGFGVQAASASDLTILAEATHCPAEEVKEPGGGLRVRLSDPDGLTVEVVYGAARVSPLAQPDPPGPVNTPRAKPRVNAGVRPPLRPSPIFKLGHVVIQRPDFERSLTWYMRHLGIIPSDVQFLADGSPALAFCRLDRGTEPSDHHSIAILGGMEVGLIHVSFETFDIDAVGQGHQYLRARGWKHYWGLGRHNLGSQFFDYWHDPVGDQWEHYADGDVMDASYPTGYHALTRGTLWTWGDDLPDSMRPDVPLEALADIHAGGGFGKLELSRVRALIEALQVPPRPWMK